MWSGNSPESDPSKFCSNPAGATTGIRTIPGFSANQIFAYFPVWSRCGPNSCDPHAGFQWPRGDVRRSRVETAAARAQTSAGMSGIQLCGGTGKPAACVRVTGPAGSHRRCPVERAACHRRNTTGTRTGVQEGGGRRAASTMS